jgi:hypothetical protein
VIKEEKLNTGSPVELNWIGLKTNQARAVVKNIWLNGTMAIILFQDKEK